jgi:hypothetical protein
MEQTLHSLIYSAPRIDIDEMIQIRKMLEKLKGPEFVKESDTNPLLINKVIIENINLRIPEEGEKISKLIEIAKEKNINYQPSQEAKAAYSLYIDRTSGSQGGSVSSYYVRVDTEEDKWGETFLSTILRLSILLLNNQCRWTTELEAK